MPGIIQQEINLAETKQLLPKSILFAITGSNMV